MNTTIVKFRNRRSRAKDDHHLFRCLFFCLPPQTAVAYVAPPEKLKAEPPGWSAGQTIGAPANPCCSPMSSSMLRVEEAERRARELNGDPVAKEEERRGG